VEIRRVAEGCIAGDCTAVEGCIGAWVWRSCWRSHCRCAGTAAVVTLEAGDTLAAEVEGCVMVVGRIAAGGGEGDTLVDEVGVLLVGAGMLAAVALE